MASLNFILSTAPSEATGLDFVQKSEVGQQNKQGCPGSHKTQRAQATDTALHPPRGKAQFASAGRKECTTSGENVN